MRGTERIHVPLSFAIYENCFLKKKIAFIFINFCKNAQFLIIYKHLEVIMIDVTKLNGSILTINEDFIETVEETPDTVITMSTGRRIIIKESRQEVVNLVKLFRKELFAE